MITKLRVKNFRQIEDETIDLSSSVVLVGPNNGGKTSILQAISLLGIAIRIWGTERFNKNSKASKRTGVAINLEDLLNIPVSEFKEIWKDLNVREGILNEQGKPTAKNIRIEIHAEGFTKNQKWAIGFEFDYGRDTLMYARLTADENGKIYDFPEIILEERIGYLPSVSGLSPSEDKLELGSIFRYIGNGKTADVLRNICFYLYDREDKAKWDLFVNEIERLFKVKLNPPQYFAINGLLKINYDEGTKKKMDLSSLGSGAKQAILMFAYLQAFPNTVNLLDEPDAHLEVIRQSEIYDKISDFAKRNNSQIIIASHSESVLNRAFGKDQVISTMFGKFEIVNEKKYIQSAIKEYGYEEYIIAKQRPYILYLEGTTDLDFIKSFCKKLDRNDFLDFLEANVYPYPVGSDVNRVRKHFAALKEFIPNLKAFALFDNLRKEIENNQAEIKIMQWHRNEIENYLPIPQSLYAYIDSENFGPLFDQRFKEIIRENIPPAALNDSNHSFWLNTKMSDDFLIPIFEKFFDEFGLPRGKMDKSKFYQLVDYSNVELFEKELIERINSIFEHFGV